MFVPMHVDLCVSFVVLSFQIILSKLPHLVRACAMAAVPVVGGSKRGRLTLVLYATLPSRQKGEIPFDTSVLYRELATVLPSHSLPDDIIIVGEFPLTPHGKPVHSNVSIKLMSVTIVTCTSYKSISIHDIGGSKDCYVSRVLVVSGKIDRRELVRKWPSSCHERCCEAERSEMMSSEELEVFLRKLVHVCAEIAPKSSVCVRLDARSSNT